MASSIFFFSSVLLGPNVVFLLDSLWPTMTTYILFYKFVQFCMGNLLQFIFLQMLTIYVIFLPSDKR
jgi:hypothetical protein